jgi:hypothetical protein
MRKKLYFIAVIQLATILLPQAAGAQEQQWLQYRSSRDARAIATDISSPYLKTISEGPESAKLPDLKEEPLLYKWSSPMAKDGYLFIALGRDQGRGLRDLLYIDSNGDGSLRDETAIKAYRAQSEHSYFGPVKVTFEGADGPISYHLNLRLCDHGERPLRVSSAGWYEGTVTVGQEQKHCVLIDHNANGTFNDKSLDPGACDRIRIGKEGSADTRFVGNFVDIDGVLYRPEIARDGACLKLAKAEDVAFGDVRVPESVNEFSAGGENGLFTFKPEGGVASLPVGKYRVYAWSMERKDEKGAQWKMQASKVSEKGLFDVTAGTVTVLPVGEPIVAALQTQERSGTYSFRHNLEGQLGESIILTRNGARPEAPKLRLKSEDGKYDRTFSFQYG